MSSTNGSTQGNTVPGLFSSSTLQAGLPLVPRRTTSTPSNSRPTTPDFTDRRSNHLDADITDGGHSSKIQGPIRPLKIPEFSSASVVNEFARSLLDRVDFLENNYVYEKNWQENMASIVENCMGCISAVMSSSAPCIEESVRNEMVGLSIALTKINTELVERRVREITVNATLQAPVLTPHSVQASSTGPAFSTQTFAPPQPRLPRVPQPGHNGYRSPLVGQLPASNISQLSMRAAVHPSGLSSGFGEIYNMLRGIQDQITNQQEQIKLLTDRNLAHSAAMHRYEQSLVNNVPVRRSRSTHPSPSRQSAGHFQNELGDRIDRSRRNSPQPQGNNNSDYTDDGGEQQTQQLLDSHRNTAEDPSIVNVGQHRNQMYHPGGSVSAEGFLAAVNSVEQDRQERGISHESSHNGFPEMVPYPNTSNFNWMEKNLTRVANNLFNLLTPECSLSLDRNTLVDIVRNVCPGVEQDRRDLSKDLTDYLRGLGSTPPNEDAVFYAEYVINASRKWVSAMRSSSRARGFHGKGLGSQVNKDLGKFGPTSEISIFEFIQRFEAKTEEYPDKSAKAKMLYDFHLEPQVKQEVQSLCTKYDRMLEKIVDKYGDLGLIVNNIIRPLRSLVMLDSNANEGECLNYFRTLLSVFQKIDHLYTFPQVNRDELGIVIYDQNLMCRLYKSLPQKSKLDFHTNLKQNKLATVPLRGSKKYKILMNTVKDAYEFYDMAVRIDDSDISGIGTKPKLQKKPPKSQVSVTTEFVKHSCDSAVGIDNNDGGDNSNDDTESLTSDSSQGQLPPSTYYTEKQKKDSQKPPKNSNSKSNSNGGKDRSKKQNKPGSLPRFSCILPCHRHGIESCPEFFSLDPETRHEHRTRAPFRMCAYCLQTGSCTPKKCDYMSSVPDILICKDCVGYCKKYNRVPYNIFTCRMKNHKRPDKDQVLAALATYLPNFSSNITSANIFLTHAFCSPGPSCSTCNGDCVCSAMSKSSPVDNAKPVPTLDTHSGKEIIVPDKDVVLESRDHSFLVMQVLQMKSERVLCFYDRGATCNLVDGALAERLGLKVVSSSPGNIGTAGDKNVQSEYGVYQFRIGPVQPENKFHELTALGLDRITTEFPKYDLNIINKEYHAECRSRNVFPEKTPKFVGGSRVGLLLGTKDFALEPQVIFRLPNGLAVLRSNLKDCFGSFICYGGPHREFTRVNNEIGGNVNGVFAFFSKVAHEYRQSIYPLSLGVYCESYDDILQIDENISVSIAKPDKSLGKLPKVVSQEYQTALGELLEADSSMDLDCESIHHCSCSVDQVFKAKIPLGKVRLHLDENDKEDLVNFRCPSCAQCRCALNPRERLLSVLEQVEQDLIQKSVNVDVKQKKCFIRLPFTQDPVKFLSKRHQGSDNRSQALRVYRSQCRKSKQELLAMIDVVNKLIDLKFMVKLSDLPDRVQSKINQAGFRHFMPWRSVMKDSSSTPIRLVVDPSMSGMNIILPKGVNQLNKILDIVIRARTKKILFSTDISKLYNQLVLDENSYQYQLFLYGNLLDPENEPDIFVLRVGWYGVLSSGNQAGFALDELARIHKDSHPRAYSTLTLNRYVDDVIDGGNTLCEVTNQVQEVKEVLAAGGFSTKFTVYSGQQPEEESGAKDGVIGMLGLRWNVVKDTLSPGFSEINFQKKRRGAKPSNPFKVATPDDVVSLLEGKNITRRMVISKISEIYDPTGIFEAYKVQLKLDARQLNGTDWDEPLTAEQQLHWIERFKQFIDVPTMKVQRCIVPHNAVSDKIRLICINDAAAMAGGCVIYGGYELPDGTFSSSLLAAKSKLLDGSIPRNELESLRLSAALAFDVKQALGEQVQDVFFFTDSMIALCWTMNTRKKLRLHVLNRVTEIRSLIKLTCGSDSEELPVFHIDGKRNVADLLTKIHGTAPIDIYSGSTWERGFPWMSLPISEIDLTRFSDISVPSQVQKLVNEECFPEITSFLSNGWSANTRIQYNGLEYKHCKGCRRPESTLPVDCCYGMASTSQHCLECLCPVNDFSLLLNKGKGESQIDLLDLIRVGWLRGLRILGYTLYVAYRWYHKVFCKDGQSKTACKMCSAIQVTNLVLHEIVKYFAEEAKNLVFRLESGTLESQLSPAKLQNFSKIEGIYYYNSRVDKPIEVVINDLDDDLYFDNTSIGGHLPVILADSPTFYALVMHIHLHVRHHAGVEITLREACKTLFAINNPRRIIQQIRKNCPKCRLIRKQTLQLEMGPHPSSRFQVAPPFYACQVDTVFGFKAKVHQKARTSVKVYALIVVCIITSATNILCLEGLATQDVVSAVERHSARYGAPAVLFVDNGTQLVSLSNASFSVRDIDYILRDSFGTRVEVSVAKNHESRGRVERKVRTLREMLQQTTTCTDLALTCLGWETLFSKIASSIDDLPLARCDKSAAADPGWEILCPNRLKLGRNNHRSIEGTIKLTEGSSPVQIMQKIHNIYQHWYQLLLNRLHHLIPRPPKWEKSDKIHLGDIVTFLYTETPNNKGVWKLGRVVNISSNGRRVDIEFPANYGRTGKMSTLPKKILTRSPRDICIIHRLDELDLNSTEYFKKVTKMNL